MVQVLSDQDMRDFGAKIGALLKGGEIFELIGDIGAGKTTLVKGLAKGLKVTDDVQSPSFTIQRSYQARDGLTLNHYDFFRLNDAGIMIQEIAESLMDPKNITVIEWGESVREVLPSEHIKIEIFYLPKIGRDIRFHFPKKFAYLSPDN